MKAADLARFIDHTLLKPDAKRADIERLCAEAREHGFAGACVNTTRIELTASLLKGSQTLPVAVVGFPLGACTTSAKAFETKDAVRLGAREIDMVINVGALKSGNAAFVEDDISAVVQAAGTTPVKVIIETALLSREEKILACELSKKAGAAFVKTSTGFSGGGATVEDVKLMRQTVGPTMGVKASGGIKSATDAQAMIAAGATRLGTSSGIAIIQGATAQGGY